MFGTISTAILFLICAMVIYGALSDLTHFRIPNWVSYGLVLLFVLHTLVVYLYTPYVPQISFQLPQWAFNVIIGLVVFVISVVFWKLRFIGGGDVKFLTATALWMGLHQALWFVILLTIIAVVFVGIMKFLRLWDIWFQASPVVPGFFKRALDKVARNELPYGLPIGIAFLILAPSLFKATEIVIPL